jgi:hypothetical protein
MSDYFTKVAMKALNAAPVVRPRLPSWFGSPGAGRGDVVEPDSGIDEQVGIQPRHLDRRAVPADRPADPELTSPLTHVNPSKPVEDAIAYPPVSEPGTQSDGGGILRRARPATAAPALETQTVASVSDRLLPGPHASLESPLAATTSAKPVLPDLNQHVSSLRPVGRQQADVSRRHTALPPSHASPRAEVTHAARRSVARAEPELPRETHWPHSALPAPISTASLNEQAEGITSFAEEPTADRVETVLGLPFRQAWLPVSGIARPAWAETVPPAVHVTIGRIEVRATPAPQPPRSERPKTQSPSRLEQYLKSRAGGARE